MRIFESKNAAKISKVFFKCLIQPQISACEEKRLQEKFQSVDKVLILRQNLRQIVGSLDIGRVKNNSGYYITYLKLTSYMVSFEVGTFFALNWLNQMVLSKKTSYRIRHSL